MNNDKKLSPVERIKLKSNGLRGTLKESLQDPLTGAIREDDQTVIKFHGIYQQDDRDRREERSDKKLEWLYSFMIRLRLPGGALTGEQWEALHHIAGEHSTGVIKITTRQTVQLHGILKSHLRPTIQSFNTFNLDSIAACGDVNRNVICSAVPGFSAIHDRLIQFSSEISAMALPKTHAFYEIWLENEPLTDKKQEEDPLYQDRYLPRKFKIAIALPPDNDVDVFANDVGLIAIVEEGKIIGYNVVAGGGLGTTHGNHHTYPRLASMLGFVKGDDNVMKVIYEIMTVQRDYGNREDRKLSRLKYTIDKLGLETFKKEVEQRSGIVFEPAKAYTFTSRGDKYGWTQDEQGLWNYTVFVENGRVLDDATVALKSALLEISKTRKSGFVFTANQNVTLTRIAQADKDEIAGILDRYRVIEATDGAGAVRRDAIACVAFNTCPLALAEAQRYLPTFISRLEPLLTKHGLQEDAISIRMTGCPNGCGRPYLAEIGFIGTAYGKYNMHLGGDRLGERLNTKYKESLEEEQILEALDTLLGAFSKEKLNGETFGDFITRTKVV